MQTSKQNADRQARLLVDITTENGRAFIATLPPDIQAMLNSHTAEIQDKSYEFRRKIIIGAGGTLELLKPENVKEQGITSLDGCKLTKGTLLLVTAVSLAYGYENADQPAPDKVRYASSDFAAASTGVPATISNADIELRAAGKLIVEKSVRQMIAGSIADVGVAANDDNMIVLSQPKVVTDAQQLQAILRASKNAVALAANPSHFLEVGFHGLLIAPKTA
ncbi:MAG: hypothetical protein KF900_14000 [Bacteroidetes bacterium]|nr:hypothetical protein [Bacteroidota bacterium]